MVHPKLDKPTEVLKLREAVPREAKVELRTMRSLVEAWEYLDQEFGQTNQLAAKQKAVLHAFQLPRTATTDSAKFRALHGIWREVYTCLDNEDLEKAQ